MSHKHDHCEHDLKYCDHCDVVYCTKCDREWGGHYHYQPYTWYYYGTPYKVTWNSIGVGGWEVYSADTGIKVTDTNVLTAFNNAIGDIDTINCGTVCTHNH